MSTIKSSNEDITINADGSGRSVKFQANGVEVASISSAGAFTSTSIDATKLSGALPAIDGSALTGMPAGGKVLQVVQGVKTDTFSTAASSASPVTITGLSASITPSATSSKILVNVVISTIGANSQTTQTLNLMRDTTSIAIGDAASLRPRVTTSGSAGVGGTFATTPAVIEFLDTPNTTSALAYTVKIGANGSSTVTVNKHSRDNNAAQADGRSISTITLMEIGA